MLNRRRLLTFVAAAVAATALPAAAAPAPVYGPSLVTGQARLLWQLQLLQRFNNALLLDYVDPVRIERGPHGTFAKPA